MNEKIAIVGVKYWIIWVFLICQNSTNFSFGHNELFQSSKLVEITQMICIKKDTCLYS